MQSDPSQIQDGIVLLVLMIKFGATNYPKLDPTFLDDGLAAFTNDCSCHWKEAYSKISKTNCYSSKLKQTKPSGMQTTFKVYTNATGENERYTDDQVWEAMASKFKRPRNQ